MTADNHRKLANKEILSIDNCRPITLLTVDYKILSLVYANRLKKQILILLFLKSESGFIKGRHISSNIRLVLDLLDYADSIHSNSLNLFLDFYKAFDTIEHLGILLLTLWLCFIKESTVQ